MNEFPGQYVGVLLLTFDSSDAHAVVGAGKHREVPVELVGFGVFERGHDESNHAVEKSALLGGGVREHLLRNWMHTNESSDQSFPEELRRRRTWCVLGIFSLAAMEFGGET